MHQLYQTRQTSLIMGDHWAERIRAHTAELITLQRMPESFDPMTSEPVGGEHFTWTAALWLGLDR